MSNLEKETTEKKNRYSSAIKNAALQWEAYKVNSAFFNCETEYKHKTVKILYLQLPNLRPLRLLF